MILYLLASLLMGVGISLDVFFSPLAQFRYFESALAARQWTVRIAATHTLFPMIGYYGVTGLLARFDYLSVILGLIAAGLIFYLLWSAARDWLDIPNEDDQSDAGGQTAPPISSAAGLSWLLVLAVSWDAILSGPAKASQVQGWSTLEILFSFPIAGLVVLMVEISPALLMAGWALLCLIVFVPLKRHFIDARYRTLCLIAGN